MKLKEDIEGKLLRNKAGALCLRRRSRRLRRAEDISTLDQVTFHFHPRYQRNLKADVIEALTVKKDLLKNLNFNKVKQLFNDQTMSESNYIDKIIEQFNKDDVYNKIIKK